MNSVWWAKMSLYMYVVCKKKNLWGAEGDMGLSISFFSCLTVYTVMMFVNLKKLKMNLRQ